MKAFMQKTLALVLAAGLLCSYGTPVFAAHTVIGQSTDITGKPYSDISNTDNRGGVFQIYDVSVSGERGNMVVNIKNSSFSGNSAPNQGYGGAIFLSNGTLNIDNTTFKGNMAAWDGGAISTATPSPGPADAAGKLVVTNSTFDGNTATEYSGGAIGLYSEAEISNSVFTNNNAGGHDPTNSTDGGGAIYMGGWAQATLSGNTFDGNSSNRGGAIGTSDAGIAAAATFNIAHSTFSNNTATKEGGAVFNKFSTLNNVISDSTFTGNAAGTEGGAIYNKGVLALKGTNVFSGNTAAGAANDIHNTGTLNIASGATTLQGGMTGTGALNVNGSSTLNIGQSTLEQDSISFANGTTLAVTFGSNAMGNLKANTITVGEGAADKASLQVSFSKDFLSETKVTRQLTNGTAVTNGSFALADVNNALYNVSFDNNEVTAVRKTQDEQSAAVAQAGGNANNAATIGAFTSSSDLGSDAANQMADVINNLAQTDVKSAVDVTTALAPEEAAGKQVVHSSAVNQLFSAVSSRMDAASAAAPRTYALGRDNASFSASDNNYSVWAQGLVNKSHKEETSGASAFTGRSTGVAAGADTKIGDEWLLGAGYGYLHTNVSSFNRHDRILGDNFFVYGQYRPGEFFVQGTLNYGDSKYEEEKYVAGTRVDADYHIKSYSANVTAGYDVNEWLTPMLGVRYMNLQQEGYADSADQSVSAEKDDYLTGVLGARVQTQTRLFGLRLEPQVTAGVAYDFVSDNAESSVVLPNGAGYNVNGERLRRLSFEAGTSVAALLSDNVELLLGYSGSFRQDYNSNTGTFKVRYMF